MTGSGRHSGRLNDAGIETERGAALDGHGPPDPSLILGAVQGDVQDTLRVAWIDPALEAATASPVFFTAAWSAIRPNVGKSFLNLARALRTDAVDAVRSSMQAVPQLRTQFEDEFSDDELRRIEDSARAAHLATAKTQIVVHALHRAIRGDRIAGTGGEEPPVRRGVPEWQRWLSGAQPTPDGARATLDDAVRTLGLVTPPAALRVIARWPAALSSAWTGLSPVAPNEAWKSGAGKLRRTVLAGMSTLPHPIELQWPALKARGFRDEERLQLEERLAAFDQEMPVHTLVAAYLWLAFGSPEIGSES